MKLHLVRHARAVKRLDRRARLEDADADGAGGPRNLDGSSCDAPPDELLRSLSEIGWGQAEALADHFSGSWPRRLVADSALRCRQTLEPLSRASGRPIELDDRLADSASLADLSELIAELADAPAVLCTHAATIRGLLTLLGIGEDSDEPEQPCRKGSIWSFEGSGGLRIERAAYREPARGRKRRTGSSKREREMVWPESVRVGVLDMGSTSFTLLVADVTRQGSIRPIVREKVMLRLGTAIANHGKLPGPLAGEAVEAARALHELAMREKTEEFRAVATASLRDARNGRKVGDRIARAIARPVDILDGETEARLMFRAFQERLSLGEDPVLGLDLGGGSLEIAVGCGRRIDRECTLGLGVVRLHSELVTTDPIRRREVRRIRERVERELASHRDDLLRRRPGRLVVAGGTPRAIARLVAVRRGEIAEEDSLPMELDLADLRAVAKSLVRSTHAERLDMAGIRRRRADLLATGAVILESVAEVLGQCHFTFCDWGLREGVLFDVMDKTSPSARESP